MAVGIRLPEARDLVWGRIINSAPQFYLDKMKHSTLWHCSAPSRPDICLGCRMNHGDNRQQDKAVLLPICCHSQLRARRNRAASAKCSPEDKLRRHSSALQVSSWSIKNRNAFPPTQDTLVFIFHIKSMLLLLPWSGHCNSWSSRSAAAGKSLLRRSRGGNRSSR